MSKTPIIDSFDTPTGQDVRLRLYLLSNQRDENPELAAEATVLLSRIGASRV